MRVQSANFYYMRPINYLRNHDDTQVRSFTVGNVAWSDSSSKRFFSLECDVQLMCSDELVLTVENETPANQWANPGMNHAITSILESKFIVKLADRATSDPKHKNTHGIK